MRKVTKIDDNNLNTTGKRIAYLRTNKGISQQELADLLKVKRQKISYIESDKPNRQLNIEELEQLATFFNVSTDYLLCRVNAQSNEYTEISKQLGLSDKSIEILKNNTIINKFIENSDYSHIWEWLDSLSIIEEYLHFIDSEYSSVDLKNGDLDSFKKYIDVCDTISSILIYYPEKYFKAFEKISEIVTRIGLLARTFKRSIPAENDDTSDFNLGKLLLLIRDDWNISSFLESYTEEDILKFAYYIVKEEAFGRQLNELKSYLNDEAELLEYKITKALGYILTKMEQSITKFDFSTNEEAIKKAESIIKNNNERKEVNENGNTGN